MKTPSLPQCAYRAALLVLLSSSSLVFAASSADRVIEDTAHPKLAHADMGFINKAARLGLEEIQLSKLAATQASREEVRNFAEKVAAAHEKANTELSTLASGKGFVLPTDSKVNIEKWSKKRGTDFDKDYLDAMIDAHKDAVELLEKNALKADDSDIAAYARNNLPAMQEHLRTAQELRKGID